MYNVVALVEPMEYAIMQYHAIDTINSSHRYELQQFDVCVLHTLYTARTGIRNKTIMRLMHRRTHDARFTNRLALLMRYNLIHRTEHGRSVYYAITLRGRRLLKEFNQLLITLTQPQPTT